MTNLLSDRDNAELISALEKLRGDQLVVSSATVEDDIFEDGVVVTLYIEAPRNRAWSADDMSRIGRGGRDLVARVLPRERIELDFADCNADAEETDDDDTYYGQLGGFKKFIA